MTRKLLLGLVFGLSAVLMAPLAADTDSTPRGRPVSFDIQFAFHTQMELPEQDVFIERDPGSGRVFRVTRADRDWRQPLYAARRPLAHNPFDPLDVGPFPKGRPLGLSLGEWFAARGTGRYTCEANRARLSLEFRALVPGGTYTLWHSFMAMPPTQPYTGTYDLPLGARDGSESVFIADAEGHARFDLEFTPCLQMSGEHLAGLLVLNWHSDHKTYGVLPGAFATVAHVQLIARLPRRTGL